MKNHDETALDLSARIAGDIRSSIIAGDLIVDERLPSEAELAEQFDVSRPTIREALKRLAAQSLIRTERGAFGGAFINRLSYDEARVQLITTSTLLLSMNSISFDTACEARFALERACAPLAATRHDPGQLDAMMAEVRRQSWAGLSDEDFCASDVAFHTALVEAAQNPVLTYQLSGAIEAMQPLMNMITFTARSRAEIVRLHDAILRALSDRDAAQVAARLTDLEDYTKTLAHTVMAARQAKSENTPKAQMATTQEDAT